MTNTTTVRYQLLFGALLLTVLLAGPASAQSQNQYDKGTPPQFAAGVSSLGSYTSADFGTVNLSNGALNLRLPLGTVGGRGLSLPLTLNWSSKIWSASIDYDRERGSGRGGLDDPNPNMVPLAYADYANADTYMSYNSRIEAGWSIGGMPFMTQRAVRINYTDIQPRGPCYDFTLPKISFTMPDRGEVEFRDDIYDGAPLPSDCGGWTATVSRGHRWHATDGSGMIYISDADNGAAGRFPDLTGVVITGDGTRFYLGGGGGCNLIVDRNGNKIRISGNNIIDPLGRATTIQQNVPDPENQNETLAVLVTVTGYGGVPRYYKVKSGTMNQHYRSGISPNLPVVTGSYDPMSWGYDSWWPATATRLFHFSYGLFAQRIDDRPVISELVLPDHRSLHFNYNEFGEVAEVQMPTGGKVWYDYGPAGSLPSGNSPAFETSAQYHTSVPFVDRAVTQRRTFPDGSTLEGVWSYSYGGTSTIVTASAPDGTIMLNQAHLFLQSGRYTDYPGSITGGHDGTYYNLWSTGIEWRTETRNASGAILAAGEQDWTQRAAVAWSTYSQEQPANDNRANEERKILDDGSTAKVHTYYQPNVKYNNPSEVQEFDFDQTLKRRSTTTYADNNNLINGLDYTSDSIHLLHLPLVMTVYDSSSNQAAQTVNEYDYYANDTLHGLLGDYGTVTEHDGNYGPGNAIRGNLTRSGHWLNTSNSFLYSYPRYDDLGNVVSVKDPNGNETFISFADDFGDGSNPDAAASGAFGPTYALPTLITSPPPTSGAPQQTARSQYDFSTGMLTGFKDRNGIITQTIYNDPFNRPTFVKTALGVAGVETHAAMYYAPGTALGITLTNNDVLTASDQNTLDDQMLRSWTRTDGFGRTVEAWSRDLQGDDQVVTIYDALGRASKQSNPLRPSLGESPAYATTNFDLAGRVKSVATSDTATVTTSYSSNTVTVTDQMGKQRTSVTDGLGRLIAVYEAPNGPNYLTSYSYDTLDNLTGVSQYDSVSNITQTRTFSYDSLKRLWSATNPESGTICYGTLSNGQCQANGYDGNGNLLYKTDARGVLSTYGYDALNRNTSISYSDNSPGVGRVYDSATNGKGRLAYQWVGAGDTSKNSLLVIDAYDALGRVKNWRQQFWGDGNWGAPYAMFSNYDLAGHVTLMHYPTGHEAYYSYDSAGRTNAFTGNLGSGGAGRNYSTGISYSALGGMSQEQFGTQTAIYNKLFYNSRGQLAEIREGRTANDDSYQLGAIINFYDTCWGQCSGQNMPINNGNLRTQQVFIPRDENPGYQNRTDMFSQGYDYDALNRLLSVEEGSWRQKYHYDRFGNRTIDTNPNETHGGVNNLGFEVEPGTNRLYAPGDLAQAETARQMRYDAAGNLKKDTYTGAGDRTYDAENRMTQAWANNQWQTYVYDADGRRVKRNVGGAGETWQVYGAGGELLAEYAANGTLQKEYGYRNGQLLITATVNAGGGWGAAPTFTDEPLNPPNAPKTDVKAIHITQLRTAINAVRAHYNLGAFQWQKPTASGGAINNSVLISWEPIDEMRTALDQALGAPSPPYTGGLALNQPILAIHIQELRNRVLAVWNSGGSGGPDIRWLVSDQLGTPRIVFDQSGSQASVSRHDYLPFGEEVPASLRNGITGYGASDGARQKFTQYERDNETGLDYAHARYYASMQGRFASPDPYVIMFEMKRGQDAEEEQEMLLEYLIQPQNWAKYNYGLNNPLNHTDPTGMRPPTRNEQNALNSLDQMADKEGDTELGRGLRAASNQISSIIAGLGRGQQDVGVNVAVNAILNIGNQAYADSATVSIRDNNGAGITIGPSNKCNVLVAETFVKGAGLNWLKNGRGYPMTNGTAPAANWLGDSRDRQHLANISIVHGGMRPGDIVAWRYSGGTYDGHSSIYIGGGVVVYAGGPAVNGWAAGTPQAQTLNYVNSRLTSLPYTLATGQHESAVVRRYNGKP